MVVIVWFVIDATCHFFLNSPGTLSSASRQKAVLLGELRSSGNGSLCPVLKKTVPYGLAYHHSGLTSEERKLVEEAYSAGVLCLLICTSTLAARINLPAQR